MSTPYVIISRHDGIINWCKTQNIEGPVIQHLNVNDIIPGTIYVGVLPIPVIETVLKAGARFWMCTSPINLKYRKSEMTADELNDHGFSLREICYLATSPIKDHIRNILTE